MCSDFTTMSYHVQKMFSFNGSHWIIFATQLSARRRSAPNETFCSQISIQHIKSFQPKRKAIHSTTIVKVSTMLKQIIFVQMLLILSMDSTVGQNTENSIRGAISRETTQRALRNMRDDDGYATDDYYYGKLVK